jgi:hypothetical protein
VSLRGVQEGAASHSEWRSRIRRRAHAFRRGPVSRTTPYVLGHDAAIRTAPCNFGARYRRPHLTDHFGRDFADRAAPSTTPHPRFRARHSSAHRNHRFGRRHADRTATVLGTGSCCSTPAGPASPTSQTQPAWLAPLCAGRGCGRSSRRTTTPGCGCCSNAVTTWPANLSACSTRSCRPHHTHRYGRSCRPHGTQGSEARHTAPHRTAWACWPARANALGAMRCAS